MGRSIYINFNGLNKSSCRKIPEQQREECNKQVEGQMTYEEYIKERQKL